MKTRTIFDFNFNDPQLEEQFYDFFRRNDFEALFTDEHRAGIITVTYSDARSLVNDGGQKANKPVWRGKKGQKEKVYKTLPEGAYHKLFMKFHDYLLIADDNKAYQRAMLKILFTANTFQKLANNIRKIMTYMDSEIDGKHKFNSWNIVYYDKGSF